MIRFAEKLVHQCKRTSRINGLYNYAVPHGKIAGSTADRFIFDPRNQLGRPGGLHRTILLVGDCFSDKTLLINAMINWIFNVQFEDPFRFEMIQNRHYEEANQKKVIVYDIHHAEGFHTPSYVDQDPARKLEISKTISTFFSDENGIQEVDMVSFVVDSSQSELLPLHLYISFSLISIFGVDIKENINYIFNYSDELNKSYFWSDIIVDAGLVPYGPFNTQWRHYHQLSTSSLIPSDREFCRADSQDLGNFFRSLEHAKIKSLTFSKQLLDQKKRLEAVMDGLRDRLREETSQLKELRKLFDSFPITADTTLTLDDYVRFKKDLLFGEYSTNCTNCQMTCHKVCGLSNEKKNCDVMDHSMPEESRACLVCPERCPWSAHTSQPFKWVYGFQSKTVSCSDFKEEYEAKLRRDLTSEELLEALNEDAKAKRKDFGKLFVAVLLSVQGLNQILRRLDPKAKPEYINVIEDTSKLVSQIILIEIREGRRGFREWIGNLKKFVLLANRVKYDVKVGENVLSSDLANYNDVDDLLSDDEEEEEIEDEEEDEDENEETDEEY